MYIKGCKWDQINNDIIEEVYWLTFWSIITWPSKSTPPPLFYLKDFVWLKYENGNSITSNFWFDFNENILLI